MAGEDAEALVDAEGLIADSVPDGMAITLLLRPDIVYLWLNGDGVVRKATPGDPDQVQEDEEADELEEAQEELDDDA
jgi:hypothetical protein